MGKLGRAAEVFPRRPLIGTNSPTVSATLPKPPKDLYRLTDPRDESAELETRARTYLHVNCSVCHVEAGGGNSMMELGLGTPREKMRLIGARPQHDTFGIENAVLIAPGDPGRSVLVHRLTRRGRGQMPPLFSNRVDERGVAMLRDWIAGLKPDQAFVRAWKMDDLTPLLDRAASGSADRGRKVFRDVGCIQCHKIEGEGGTVGPDLNGMARRVVAKELLESIVEPSKVIAEAYAGVRIATHDGTLYSERIDREDDRVVVLGPTPPAEAVTIPKTEIAERRRSDQSNMPTGMLNVLREDQILDLLAFLLGDPRPRSPKP